MQYKSQIKRFTNKTEPSKATHKYSKNANEKKNKTGESSTRKMINISHHNWYAYSQMVSI